MTFWAGILIGWMFGVACATIGLAILTAGNQADRWAAGYQKGLEVGRVVRRVRRQRSAFTEPGEPVLDMFSRN